MMLKYFILISFCTTLFAQDELIERWHSFDDIQDSLFSWNAQFGDDSAPPLGYPPDSGPLFHLEQIGHSSLDNVPIWAVKLSFNADVDEDEPRLLFLGQCHAEEIYGVEVAMEIIDVFLHPTQLTGYMSVFIPYIMPLMQSTEIWVIPTYNPEGLQMVHGYEVDSEWLQDVSYRKNKTDVNLNGIFDFDVGVGNDSDGVDLNRNYDFNWFMGDDAFEPDPGNCNPSYFAHYDYYRGAAPFSEPEAQAIRDFAIDNHFLLSIAFHSSRSGCVSEKVIYPWEWDDDGKTSPDWQVISPLGIELANHIPVENGDGFYTPVSSKSRKGNAHDWFYSNTGCIQYLIEMGNENLQPDDPDLIDDTVFRNLKGVFFLMNRAIGFGQYELGAESYQVTGLITDAATGNPIDADVKILEMDGPMLKPRVTDEFGRYRRLLYPGTFTIVVSARGYSAQTQTVTSSSSIINTADFELQPSSVYQLNLNVNTPDLYSDQLFAVYADEVGADTILIDAGINEFLLPENSYHFSITGTETYPVIFDVELFEETTVEVDIKWSGILFEASFDNLDDWTVQTGDWYSNFGSLLSQPDLLYGSGSHSIIADQLINSSDYENLALYLNFGYEIEWDNDTVSVVVQNEFDTTIVSWCDQNWDIHEEYHYLDIAPADSNRLNINLNTDNTLGYRGLEIDHLSILYEPDGDCPQGDINRDGVIDILDVINIIENVLSDEGITGFEYCTSELTGDAQIDILDLVYLVAMIINE